MQMLFVGLGGFCGAVARYGVGRLFSGSTFPMATLCVNVLGSLLIGFFVVTLSVRDSGAEPLRLFLIVGFLGAFTTFSTFSMETLNLLQGDTWIKAFVNIMANVSLCLLAVAVGASFGRHLVH